MNRACVTLLFAAALVACNKGEGDKSAASASASAAPVALSASPALSAIAKAVAPAASAAPEPVDQPPTEQKADNKAARELTPANYKAELVKLQKEIGSP